MSDPAEEIQPAAIAVSLTETPNVRLASTMRVLRGRVTKERLVSCFPVLEMTSLTDASQLFEMNKRVLLDLPD